MAKQQCLEISLFLVVVVLWLACSESQPCQAGSHFSIFFTRVVSNNYFNYIYIVFCFFVILHVLVYSAFLVWL